MERIRSEPSLSESKLLFLKLDLSSLDSVRAFVKAFRDSGLPLHVLVLVLLTRVSVYGCTGDRWYHPYDPLLPTRL